MHQTYQENMSYVHVTCHISRIKTPLRHYPPVIRALADAKRCSCYLFLFVWRQTQTDRRSKDSKAQARSFTGHSHLVANWQIEAVAVHVFRSSTCFRSWTGKQRRGPRIGRPQCLRREENPRNCETTNGGVEPTWTTTFELLGIGRCRFINLRASPSESTAMETKICCTRVRCVHFRTRPASAISMRLGAWRLDVKDQEQRNTETWIDVNCTLSLISLSLSLSRCSLMKHHMCPSICIHSVCTCSACWKCRFDGFTLLD